MTRRQRMTRRPSTPKHLSGKRAHPQIVEAVGGADNISGVNACFTRLRLSLKDTALVKDDSVFTKDLGASAIVHVGGGVQIVYGNKASVYKVEMREYLGME